MNQIFRSCDITKLPDTFVIPSGVTDLSEAFKSSDITNAPVIPNGVTNLKETFASCVNLKTYIGSSDPDGDFSNYIIPNTAKNLYEMFYTCTSLTIAPTLPTTAKDTTLMFYGCSSIASIVIPETITKIDYGLLRACRALANITFKGTIDDWNAISFGNDWNQYCGQITVICMDGEIVIPAYGS